MLGGQAFITGARIAMPTLANPTTITMLAAHASIGCPGVGATLRVTGEATKGGGAGRGGTAGLGGGTGKSIGGGTAAAGSGIGGGAGGTTGFAAAGPGAAGCTATGSGSATGAGSGAGSGAGGGGAGGAAAATAGSGAAATGAAGGAGGGAGACAAASAAPGTHSFVQRAHRSGRIAASTDPGTSYVASQFGQLIFMEDPSAAASCKIGRPLGNNHRGTAHCTLPRLLELFSRQRHRVVQGVETPADVLK